MKYINVVIDNKSRYTDTFYTYATDTDIPIGTIVNVPFNRGNKIKMAYVFQVDSIPDCDLEKVKEVESIFTDYALTSESIETIKWMKTRYGIKYIDGIKCFLPNGKLAKEGKEKEPYADATGEKQNIKRLTDEQTEAISIINEAIDFNRQENFLIHGVTSSGKTEVYMQAISEVIGNGKTAIMLVPEIALTKQVIERFISRFGKEQIAVLHSKLTTRERFDEWMRLYRGEAKIAIGARIGVFAPLKNIGLIIMDEEHEATYKSDMTPKYETVDVALKRLMHYKGVLIMGSATPSVVSYERAKEGIYKLIELKKRYNEVAMPKVTLVDMRKELMEGNKTIFSHLLYEKLLQALEKKQQIILFLNRRGYSTFVSCRECGSVMKCPECDISLTYHKHENAGVCHYCGKKFHIPEACPSCGSKYIKYFGTGTEKVEEFVKETFPDRVVERLDLDTAKNTREINRIISNFSKGRTDILIGTQLVAKGLDFKNVGLVGVISADVSLNIPDYRSTERTFQLVTQVAGRAGRGDDEGEVIVQSYTPENFALKAAAKYDYQEFFHQEIQIRQMMKYPPFSDLILVSFTSDHQSNAINAAEECKAFLEKTGIKGSDSVFSPKVSSNFKGKNSFRYYIFVKCPKGMRNEYIYFLNAFGEKSITHNNKWVMTIDVNPYSIF